MEFPRVIALYMLATTGRVWQIGWKAILGIFHRRSRVSLIPYWLPSISWKKCGTPRETPPSSGFFHVSATGDDRIGAHDFLAAIVSRERRERSIVGRHKLLMRLLAAIVNHSSQEYGRNAADPPRTLIVKIIPSRWRKAAYLTPEIYRYNRDWRERHKLGESQISDATLNGELVASRAGIKTWETVFVWEVRVDLKLLQ